MRYLFETVKFDAVIHMAAQAGVAYSVVNPISYVTANIECLVNLLDILADYQVYKCINVTVNHWTTSVVLNVNQIPLTSKKCLEWLATFFL